MSKLKVIGINGSPRKKWNTATLIKKALEGSESKGAEAELINLYDLNFKGCKSCFSCRTKGSKSYGKCAMNDDLTPILKNIEESDALVLGSPIYLGTITGEMKSFLERLIFPYLTYTNPPQSLFPKKINSMFIFTMGIPEEIVEESGYNVHFKTIEHYLEFISESSELLFSFDTYQFKDYSKVVTDRFDADKKAKRREKVFPLGCQKAFDKGIKILSEKIDK